MCDRVCKDISDKVGSGEKCFYCSNRGICSQPILTQYSISLSLENVRKPKISGPSWKGKLKKLIFQILDK